MGKLKDLKVDVSIVIVSYNTLQLTTECIESIFKNVKGVTLEVVVVDNDSPDNSGVELKKLETKFKGLTVIASKDNLGFARGNNLGIKKTSGRYLLFLNPDTIVFPNTIETMVDFMDDHKDAGSATCELKLPKGGIDEASHRGFPTPWNSFCHFSGLEKIFPKTKVFGGYVQGWKDLKTIHEIDALAGAFMIVPRKLGEEIGWWDEDFFFYGEDLSFCYEIRKRGYKIYYVPAVSILHYGGVSSGIKKSSQGITTANIKTRTMVQNERFRAMKLFYQKHYVNKYPKPVTYLVYKGIDYLHQKNLPKLSN